MKKNIIGLSVILMLLLVLIGIDFKKNARNLNVWIHFFMHPKFANVSIQSSLDGEIQKAVFYKTKFQKPQPLIVSLHTWGGNYLQKDELAQLSKEVGINYIHPNFRGANKDKENCCSDLVISDIDDAISFAVTHGNVDTSRIFLIGSSGGGYATICAFMKSKHPIRKFSAWVPITDLIAWFEESKERKVEYRIDILNCTESVGNILNIENAKKRSPIFWDTPIEKLKTSEISIYTGIYDGINGSVPITHSIHFYNKLLMDLEVSDSTKFVSDREKNDLLARDKKLGTFEKIGNREVFLKKQFQQVSLVIFDGGHEILSEYALKELLEE